MYHHLKPRITVFLLPSAEPFVSHLEQDLFHRVHRFAPACYYSSPEWKNQTLAPKRDFHGFILPQGRHRFSYMLGNFADNTAVVGIISHSNEAAYRSEIIHLESRCRENNLLLNSSKAKELILDLRRKRQSDIRPLWISGSEVERVYSFKSLGVIITRDLSWSLHVNRTGKLARQCLFHPQMPERLWAPPQGAQELLHPHHREHLEWEHHHLHGQLH